MNTTVAELISHSLANGLEHPGYPNTEQGPVTMQLPFNPLAAQPPEMREQINEFVKMVGEAIVHTIEKQGITFITAEEYEALKSELAQLKESK